MTLGHRIAILGSTGSIGTSALEVIRHLGAEYQAIALSAHQQLERLASQARECRPAALGVADIRHAQALKELAGAIGATPYIGLDGIAEMVQRDDVDMVLAAIVGAAGLGPVLAAVQAGKRLALANKESLVVGGSLLIPEARRRNLPILPVDSEHSAVFQALASGKVAEVKRVVLTASGGPFRTWPIERMRSASPADALNHPTWQMGAKITIDSATMFNKALELIEACWLFDLPPNKIEVVIHPESIVHSMVEFIDGSIIAQLSPPDMRTPIQYALTYPHRKAGIGPTLDLSQALSLHFEPPDFQRFPALRLAYDVAERRGSLGAVLNAANEVAVAQFMAGKLPFGMICRVVELTIRRHTLQPHPSLDDLLEADRWARQTVGELVQRSEQLDCGAA